MGKVLRFTRRIDHQPDGLAKARDHQIIANAAIGMGQQCVADAPLAQCRYAAGHQFFHKQGSITITRDWAQPRLAHMRHVK